ncbi:MAG: hypothetical protein ABWW66_08315, partial [Archaeoglobaceae archaeon]
LGAVIDDAFRESINQRWIVFSQHFQGFFKGVRMWLNVNFNVKNVKQILTPIQISFPKICYNE